MSDGTTSFTMPEIDRKKFQEEIEAFTPGTTPRVVKPTTSPDSMQAAIDAKYKKPGSQNPKDIDGYQPFAVRHEEWRKRRSEPILRTTLRPRENESK